MTAVPRILVVTFIHTGGGVTESMFTCLEMLRRSAAHVVALVPERFVFLDRLKADRVEAETISNFERAGRFRIPLQAYKIAHIARRQAVDLIVVNNGRHVAWLTRLTAIPVLAIYHGGKVERFLSAARVITINDDQRELLISAGYDAGKVTVVDNCLPVDELPPFHARAEDGDPIIGTLRLLEPAKGVDVLIEAIAIVAKRGLRLKTRIGSSGSQHAMLEERVRTLGLSDLVSFLGWIDDKERFYRDIDIYVLPSRTEEWGIGIVEAQAAGLPVIATACYGPKRIIRDGETGMLVPPGAPDRMADAIEELVRDAGKRRALARSGYDYARAHYTLKQVAPIYSEAVLAALTPRARSLDQ